ncbi:hypothetical protein P8C59_004391 [Phyllachora maydis]|uniref:JmjC domain-containing protein n=1 Tax=Phyllachora maydis TaxID=1825666 RepID=A0AAD9I3H0_9PEZI|nr:hypothetical protein P8C59_004391 [Phyllachora maydis]
MTPSLQMHPQAKFDPIPPDLDLHGLVDGTANFEWVTRITAAQIRQIGPAEFERLVLIHVIHGGKPIVIEKWNVQLGKGLFTAEWLEKNYDKKQENVRDVTNQTDIPMTTGHYLRSMKQLTNQWTPTNFRDERRQRLYLKDIDCPPEWHEKLQKILPPNIFYLNENVERRGNIPNENFDDDLDGSYNPAPAGDLMSSLPESMRAQNLMCYIGHEGTYTPAHKEMCASLGQNIMVDASGDDRGEKSGSSIWFMTETRDREVVREYFLSMLGHDIEIEKHFAQINAWKKANFPVYIVEQRVGDLILVPPLAAHQVWNRGTRTMKVAWNRTTVETLEKALHEALPRARIVCRDEQYKNKAIVFYTLQKYYKQMTELEANADMGLLGISRELVRESPRMKQLARDFKALFALYTEILVDEMFVTKEKDVETVEFDSNITCSYCRANIFNRFLTCKNCVRQLVTGDEDTYDVCMECYAMGRSCVCLSGLKWCEQWNWAELTGSYELWRTLIIQNDGFVDFELSPLPLEISRRKFGKKAVAQICQEQLRRRPFKDVTKPAPKVVPEEEPSEPEVDDEGRLKKKKKRKTKKGDVYTCHVCCHKDYTYRLAFCTNSGCGFAFCYGVLHRAFDMMPQEVMQNERWECPKCLKICNCAACRRQGSGQPYVPKNTLLGHDTRSVADDRSVESLVDFRLHNLVWVRNSGDVTRDRNSKRMQRLQQAAEADKANAADLSQDVTALAADDVEAADNAEGAVPPSGLNSYGDQIEPTVAPNDEPEISEQTPIDPQTEALDNMDPALFGGEGVAAAIDPSLEDATAEPEGPPMDIGQGQVGAENDGAPQEYSPNVPALRHAKPKTSYAEADGGEEEFNEMFIPRSKRPPPPPGSEPSRPARDALALAASAAMRALGETPAPAAVNASGSGGPKKRGRPPGRPGKSDAGAADKASPAASSAASASAAAKRRRRFPRSSLAVAESSLVAERDKDKDSPDELEAQLARELASLDDDGDLIASAASPPPQDKTEVSTDGVDLPPPGAQPKVPQSQALTVELPAKQSLVAGTDQGGLLSMADRMRLKGKSFKIGKKSSLLAASTRASTPATTTNDLPAPAPMDIDDMVDTTSAGASASGSRQSPKDDENFNPDAAEDPLSDGHRDEVDTAGGSGYNSSRPASVQPAVQPAVHPAFQPAAQPATKTMAKTAAARQPSPPPKLSGPTIVCLGDPEEDGDDYYSDSRGTPSVAGSAVDRGDSEESSEDEDDEDIPAQVTAVAAVAGDVAGDAAVVVLPFDSVIIRM